MSKWGLASLTIATLCLIIVLVARFILGGWLDMLWFPLGMGIVSFSVLIITEFRTILDFLTMRTTKNGMNMGMIILLMVVVLASVNYLSIRYNKTFDLTEEMDTGEEVISRFFDKVNADEIDLTSVYPRLENEQLSAISEIARLLRLKGYQVDEADSAS